MSDRFSSPTYLVRRKVFTLAGAAFHIRDGLGRLVLYSKLKAFRLKEDLRLFTGEDMREELLAIHARSVLDISATYDVTDSRTGERGGAIRRKGVRSLLRDEWVFLDAGDREFGVIREDSMGLALLRRFLTNLVPQRFDVDVMGKRVATVRQDFNPFVLRLTVDFSQDPTGLLDRRPGAGCRPPPLRGRRPAGLSAEGGRSLSPPGRPASAPSRGEPGRPPASR